MDINKMLDSYRKGFGLVREGGMKSAMGQNPRTSSSDMGGAQWDTALTIPEAKVSPGWGARVDLPEELPDARDERDMGDTAINEENFKAYLQEHPFSQKYGADIGKMVEELAGMVQDPENPMTYEEAQRVYTEEFSKMYETWEMGGDQ